MPPVRANTGYYLDKSSPVLAVYSTATSGFGEAILASAIAPESIAIEAWANGADSSAISAKAFNPSAVPILATGHVQAGAQTANLQEWHCSIEQQYPAPDLDVTMAVINKDGKLGIGTATPSYLLDLKDGTSGNGLRIGTTNWSAIPWPGTIPEAAVSNARGYSFAMDGKTLSPGTSFGIGMAMSRPDPALWIKNLGGPAMYVEAGKVGIGTKTPTEALHVVGKVRATGGLVTGDVEFANGYKLTEDEESGMLLVNQKGEGIARFDEQGNLHIKGKVLEDL